MRRTITTWLLSGVLIAFALVAMPACQDKCELKLTCVTGSSSSGGSGQEGGMGGQSVSSSAGGANAGGMGGAGGQEEPPTIVALAMGPEHTCVAFDSAETYCWGRDQWGQLGNGSFQDSPVPVLVGGRPPLPPATGLAAGSSHTCAVHDGGVLSCWGSNGYGQLGSGDNNTLALPSETLVSDATHVAAGSFHTCARLGTGLVQCWGSNVWCQLGDCALDNSPTPVLISGVQQSLQTANTSSSTCSLRSFGDVFCWGSNLVGELGIGSLSNNVATPSKVVGLDDVAQIDCGGGHCCAVLDTGALSCWGSNWYGQLGYDALISSHTAELVSIPATITQVATGGGHTCALSNLGEVYCWGQVTNNIMLTQPTLMEIPEPISLLASGNSATCGASGSQLYCWGNNAYGQLGDGTTEDRETPVLVTFP